MLALLSRIYADFGGTLPPSDTVPLGLAGWAVGEVVDPTAAGLATGAVTIFSDAAVAGGAADILAALVAAACALLSRGPVAEAAVPFVDASFGVATSLGTAEGLGVTAGVVPLEPIADDDGLDEAALIVGADFVAVVTVVAAGVEGAVVGEGLAGAAVVGAAAMTGSLAATLILPVTVPEERCTAGGAPLKMSLMGTCTLAAFTPPALLRVAVLALPLPDLSASRIPSQRLAGLAQERS